MAKNLFINTTGLPIEKEMPSLVGMDLSGINKEPLKLNLGKVISDFANRAQELKEQASATKLSNQLLDEEQAWRIEYLSDPNAFANKDRRTEIAKSYNDLIERKKALIMGAQSKLNAQQYGAVEAQFKQQTYNSLFDLQTKMNSAFVQESVESLGIEKNALIIKCTNTGNRNEIMQYQEMLAECFNAEASLGIDNREQAIKTLMTIEDNYLQRKVVDEIINNTTAKEYAKIDDDGSPILDTSGNYIIDTNKVLTAVTQQRAYLLSREGISGDAKKIAKMYNMSEDEAYNYIYNARDQFFKVRQNNIQANLIQKSELEKLQLVELEEEMNEKREKVAIGITKDLNNGEPLTKIAENFNSYLDESAYFNQLYFNRYTNGEFNNIIEMEKKGMYIPVTSNATIDKISGDIARAKTETEISGAIQGLQNIQTTKGAYNNFQLIQIQNRNGIPYGTTSALLGRKEGITQKEAMEIYIANQRNDLTVKNIDRSYKSHKFPFAMTDVENLDKVLKNVDSYPDKFFTEKQKEEYLKKNVASEKFNFIVNAYNDKRNANTINSINSLSTNINKMNTVNNTTLYQTDKTRNSQILKYGLDVTDNQLKKRNAKKLYNAGEGNKLFDVDSSGNIVSAYGYPRDAESLSTTDLDAYNSVLKELLYAKKINFGVINNFEKGVIFSNQHNFDYFSRVILDMMKENKLNDINMIISIPTIFSDNNPEIKKFIEDYEKTIK